MSGGVVVVVFVIVVLLVVIVAALVVVVMLIIAMFWGPKTKFKGSKRSYGRVGKFRNATGP